MGGSGGNSSFGSFGPRDRQEIACESLRFRTSVIGPDLSILSALTVGDVLSVVLNQQHQSSINLVTSQGQILGSILPSELGRLIQCINGGTNYEAKIQDIRSPKCVVDVYPV